MHPTMFNRLDVPDLDEVTAGCCGCLFGVAVVFAILGFVVGVFVIEFFVVQ